MGGVDNGGEYARVEAEGLWEILVPSSQFRSEHKTAKRKKKPLKIKDNMQNEREYL